MTVPNEWLSPEQKQEFFQKCNSADCQTAVTRLVNARNAFAKPCNDSQVWNNLRNVYAALATTAFTAAAAAAIAGAAATASIFGIPLGIVLFVAAVAFLAAALLFVVLAVNAAVQYGNAQDAITNAQEDFSAALLDARTECGPYCNIGDQNMPKC